MSDNKEKEKMIFAYKTTKKKHSFTKSSFKKGRMELN